MKASVVLTLQMTEKEGYKVKLDLPTAAPTPAAPFLFCVTQVVEDVDGEDVLEVAVADDAHYFVGVAPPNSLLAEAGIADVVKELEVVVAEGKYNRQTKKFDS